MNKRIRKKVEKRFFLACFNKKDWILYNRYPRLFPTYSTYHEFSLDDLDRWYWNKFSCNKDIFQNIVKTLSCYVNFDSTNADFKNPYFNLEKYKLRELMDNIESVWINERLPKRIEEQLAHYLINIPKINTSDAIKNILNVNLDSVNNLGLTVKNADGTFKNLNDILLEISEKWN